MFRGNNSDSNRPIQNKRENCNDGYEFNDMRNELDNVQNNNRPPVTYEPRILNHDENELFATSIPTGIEFSNYNKINIDITGGCSNEKINLIQSFHNIELHPTILENIKKSGYTTPTPIQKAAINIILNYNNDIMACAQTGSGKTAAFLIPIFSKLLKNPQSLNQILHCPAPKVLCIGPTRELVQQIFFEMEKFSFRTNIKCSRVYGGLARSFILRGLSQDCVALAATPGRLLALLRSGHVTLENLEYLVLDEADKMLDMGFINDIRTIINSFGMPTFKTNRRTFMFSATFPKEIQKLASEILESSYFYIAIGTVGGAADSIKQVFEKVQMYEKREKLLQILTGFEKNIKILIFVETKRQADYLTVYLCESGFSAISIHGDRLQEQREEALYCFKTGECCILVATSVAARGLDIPGVDVVVNYDFPSEIEEYVHRIGRTGRIGNTGMAISFFQDGRDEAMSKGIVKILRDSKQELPEWLELISDQSMGTGSSRYGNKKDYRIKPGNENNIQHQRFNAMANNPYNEEVMLEDTKASTWKTDDDETW